MKFPVMAGFAFEGYAAPARTPLQGVPTVGPRSAVPTPPNTRLAKLLSNLDSYIEELEDITQCSSLEEENIRHEVANRLKVLKDSAS